MTISQWGDKYYKLPEEHGGGDWRTKPIQKGIADAMCAAHLERITVKKSMRVGYTKLLNLVVAYHIHADPCSTLIVQPTIEDAEGYSKDELAPMIRDVPVLQEKIKKGESLKKIRYPGGATTIVGANSPTGFRRITVTVVIFDETSAYPKNTGTDGDPVRQGEGRTFSAFNRKIINGSTPGVEGECRIDKEYKRSDQRYYYVPCPHCGHSHVLKWANFKWPDGKPEKAHFVCPSCKRDIEETDKLDMLAKGEWRATEPFTCCGKEQKPQRWDALGGALCEECGLPASDHGGFHLWAAYSDLPNAKWSKLAEEWDKVKDDLEERVVYINTIRGECYKETVDEVDWKPLYQRREDYFAEEKEIVPEAVRIILGAVDTQDNRLEFKSVGIGEGEEAWILRRKIFFGAPDDEGTQAQLDRELEHVYTHAYGHQMTVTACGVDVQGHYYNTMVEYCAYRQHVCLALRGGNDIAAPSIRPPTRNNEFKIPLYTLGVNTTKNRLLPRLKYKFPGRKYIHFPKNNDFEQDYFEQLTAEEVVYEKKNGLMYRVFKCPSGVRNEAWDLLVYVFSVLWIYNPDLSEIFALDNESDEEYEEESGWMNQ